MEYTFSPKQAGRKKLFLVVILVIGALGAYFMSKGTSRGSENIVEEALMGVEDQVVVIPSEATTSEPSIYRGSSVTSKKKAPADSGSTPQNAKINVPEWCDWQTGTASATTDIVLSESNSSWIGVKNVSSRDLNTAGWQIISSDGKIKIKLTGKILEAGKSYHVARPDAGEAADLAAWLKLLQKDCDLVAEVNSPKKDQPVTETASSVPTTTVSQTTSNPAPIVVPVTTSSPSTADIPSAPIVSIPVASIPAPTTTATSSTPLEPAPASTSTLANEVDHLVIARIEIGGAAGESSHDLVKIYNPTTEALDISGFKLRKRSSSGSEVSVRVFPKNSIVQAKSYFVWANSDYSAEANSTSTQTLSEDNSLAFLKADDNLIDAVGWGKGKDQFKERDIYPLNPASGKALVRKFVGDAIKDTDNNSEDFEVK